MLLVAAAALGLFAGSAGAASSYQLSVTPKRVGPGGTVTLTTTPRTACSVRVTLLGKHYSHTMPYGWMQIKIPRRAGIGHISLRVSCGGQVTKASFIVAKKHKK